MIAAARLATAVFLWWTSPPTAGSRATAEPTPPRRRAGGVELKEGHHGRAVSAGSPGTARGRGPGPYLIYPDVTLQDAAALPATLRFLLYSLAGA